MTGAIAHADALARLRAGPADPPPAAIDTAALLRAWHPDHRPGARTALRIGANRGDACHPALAALLESNALVEDLDLAGTTPLRTDVLVIGGGGAGASAALSAAADGADVLLASKLRVGDSNTVMAEGGIQAAVGADDSLQRHYDDTFAAGHRAADPALVATLVGDGPGAIRWLMDLGVAFDRTAEDPGMLLRKRAGGTSAARILSHRDFTGLEIMRVLAEAVDLDRAITVLNRAPAVELLTNQRGDCVGAVLYDLEYRRFRLVQAGAVILATGGSGRLHLEGFPTSNHYGATADGLVLAYRAGARLRDVDSFQYHPTGVAWPHHLAGGLISEAARSAGAHLRNGTGARFIDELSPRDVVAAAILRECAEGRGIGRDGAVGVFLDTPALLRGTPGLLETQLVSLAHLAARCGIDPAAEPLLVTPTLHYQNGGVAIGGDGATGVEGLFCAGEIAGGIHGRNRLMGNALLEIVAFGRRAGRAASAAARLHETGIGIGRAGIFHLQQWRRDMVRAGLPLDRRAPALYPAYGNFDLRAHLASTRAVA